MTEHMPATPELVRLNPFAGVWHTEGEMKDRSSASPVRFAAADTYEWMAGGHFLLHRFDADMPEGKVQGIEVIGYSRETGSYPMHSFDSTGNASVMQGRIEGDVWTFTGESLRFTGGFRESGMVFSGRWEFRSGDETTWQPLMDVTLRKTLIH